MAADLIVASSTAGAGATSTRGDAEWRFTRVDTPLGPLVVTVSPRGVVAADIGVDEHAHLAALETRYAVAIRRDDRGLGGLRAEVHAYFGREPRPLTAAVDVTIARTAFWRRVYEATIAVPFGELRTYGDVAAAAGSPRAWRAAGHALRHCPIELWIPCHRVVPSGPGLGSYGGRPDVRAFLLRHEGSLPARPTGRSGFRTGR